MHLAAAASAGESKERTCYIRNSASGHDGINRHLLLMLKTFFPFCWKLLLCRTRDASLWLHCRGNKKFCVLKELCSPRWMLPSRPPLLQCESDRVWLVISCWPWRQGGEGLSESQSAACGMSIQERSQEAFEGRHWVWYLLGGPKSLRFFLHLISTIVELGFFSFSLMIFSAPDFQEGKNKGIADGTFLMWGSDFWVCLEFITWNADKVYQISQAAGEKTAGRLKYFFVAFSYVDSVSVLAD